MKLTVSPTISPAPIRFAEDEERERKKATNHWTRLSICVKTQILPRLTSFLPSQSQPTILLGFHKNARAVVDRLCLPVQNWIATLHIVHTDAEELPLGALRSVCMVDDRGTECSKWAGGFNFVESEVRASDPMGAGREGDYVFCEFGGRVRMVIMIMIVRFVAVGEVDEEEEEDTED